MKTKEELDAIKKDVEALKGKLAELSEDELKHIVGGIVNHEGSIQEVIGPWDIHVKLKEILEVP